MSLKLGLKIDSKWGKKIFFRNLATIKNNKSYQIFSHKTNKENLNNYLKPKEEEEIKFEWQLNLCKCQRR